jgi:hypothetical protein
VADHKETSRARTHVFGEKGEWVFKIFCKIKVFGYQYYTENQKYRINAFPSLMNQ